MAPTSLASYQALEDELPYIINHVFLPPKLPQSSDSRIERNEVLLEALRLACHEFVKQHVRHASVSKDGRSIQLGENWENIEGMLATTGVIYTSRTDADVLEKQMNNMWPGEVITLYIQAQNAGVIIRKPATNNGKEISIESFEAAAPTAKVMSGERRMLVNYPGPSVTLPDTVFHNPGFAHELAQFLADMNYSEMKNAQRTTQKAQGEHKEIRDSNRCIYITELLTGLLQGVGGVATRSLERIEKRIADDVVWKKALLPWRRSPFWLVMRVALQTSIVRDADGGFRGYKALMLFFMSRVLDVAVRRNVSSDLLRVMSGKISRRAFKLKSYGGEDIYGVLPVAGKSVENAVAELERRWASVQERHVQSMTRTWDPAALDIGNAAKLTMTNSSGHIEAILNAHKNGRPMAQYRGGTGTGLTNRIDPLNFDPDRLGHYISEATKKGRREKLVLLADFEDWVASRAGGLSDWTAGHLSTDGNRAISTAINSYYSFACLAYGKNPERLSIMLLTVLEMWIALDKITVELFPTLRDYPAAAELNLETLQKLLLPRRAQMGRLAAAEAYLLSRRAGSRYKSIFSDDVSDSSFSVRYVLYSAPHLELIRAIEDAARTERNAREQEMLAANTAYAEQMRLYNSKAGCTYNQWGGHDRLTCDRCQHKHIADGLSVAIHEWPLPEGRSEKYAVAFELDPPAAFAAYRDTTYTLMAVVFSPEMDAGRDEPLCTFARYAGLRAHSRADGAQTVVWASATKSFSQSHYGSQAAPTDAAAIFQKHALQYRLHDAARKTWVRAALNRCSVASAVTLRLPDGPYGNLQYALDGTAHTSNRVVAGQDDCDPALLLAEYDAFCTLRAGHRLQWLSIARELAARVLAFGRAEVWLLVMQAAWEAGPPGDAAPSAVCRDAHVHLQDSRYCGDVIAAMEGMLGTIESNWCQGVAARTLIVITTRLLSVNQDSAVADRALLLLRRLRAVAFAWTQQLVRQNQGAPDAATQQLLLEMAITTHMTFNVDSAFMSRVLSREEDISSFIQCLIIVHDNTPADITSLPYTTQLLLDQDNQLSHDIQSSVVSALQSNRRGLDHAIKQAWSVYPGYDKADKMSLWTIPFPYFTSSTVTRTITLSAQDGGGEKLVQVDILTGQLLINGAPFGRLPTEYTSHPTYSRIFGQDILDVCPCGGSGEMKYQMKQKMGGNEVFFALRLRNLVIRLQTPAPESHTFEIITNTLFKDDFPDPLVQNFAHCLNLNTGTLEFRPLDGIWRSSAENWSIDLSDQPIFMQRVIDGTTSWMADYRSKAASMISKLLSAIEEKSNLQIILHPMPSPHRLVVHLHRYSLDFALNDRGLLECTSLPGLVIDSRQDMGTMIGLSNYLVLCEIGQLSKYGRHVLIPRGKIEYTMGLCDKHNNGHTVTRISTTGMSKVAYHKYKIDAILGRLVGNTTMASRLYQNHLHALTSFCLPDPLTGITGTQTSLENLQQASMSSFQKITMHEVELLESIAKLTPIRVWYPDHLQVMQTVEWDGHLPATSQHAGFLKTALSILEHWEKISFFYPNESQIEWKKAFEKHLKSPMHLRKRAEIRNSVWFSETSDTYDSGTDITHVPYVQAKIEKKGQLEAQSQHIATLAVNWSRDLQVPQEIFQDFRTWDGKILGTNSVEMPLGYYTELHEVPLGSIWMPLHKQFSQATRDDRFGMAFLLGVLAYKSAASMEQLETLLAFATIPEITRNLNSFLEQYSSFDLKDGFTFQDDAISSFIRSYCLRTFRDSPQFSLPSNFGEQPYQTQSRRQRTYNAASNTEVSEAVRFISVYRDYERFPPIQYELGLKSLELIRFYPHTRTALDDRLGSFYRNRKLREHITRINALLDSHLPRRFTSHCVKVSPYNYEYFSGYRMPVSVDITLSRLVENLAPLAPKSVLHAPSYFPSQHAFASINDRKIGAMDPAKDQQLLQLIQDFGNGSVGFEKQYTEDMLKSWNALRAKAEQSLDYTDDILVAYEGLWERYLNGILAVFKYNLLPANPTITSYPTSADYAMYRSIIWPAVTPISILRFLRGRHWSSLSEDWRVLVVQYALALIGLQRAQRLLHHFRNDDTAEFKKDLHNTGCQGWDPEMYPEWLLFQIENAVVIRPVQADIAMEMMAPSGGENAVMQLNMGEGKSSVIVPAIAAALADGTKLVRVIVLKPLARQMFRLLVGKLGGVVNRRIYFLPFSRDVKMDDPSTAVKIQKLYEECMDVGGILLVQPEHLLSFKLMGIVQIDGDGPYPIAKELIKSQMWLEKHARDILDESDEILSVKYQLLYTIGLQTAFDGAPQRWAVTQQVFAILRRHILELKDKYPGEVQVELEHCTGARFPLTRILSKDVEKELLDLTAATIRDNGLSCTSFAYLREDIRNLAHKYITTEEFSVKEFSALMSNCSANDLTILHLLRGLITYRILSFSLREKRYRVDYGLLAPDADGLAPRTMLAVPYRAKDSPAPRAEFGHPDVTITLTCLTYYYRGLEKEELTICFEHLYKRDSPELEYDRWVSEAAGTVPADIRDLRGVNLLDQRQFAEQILPTFCFNKATIDFYLSTKVFPVAAKEFRHKVSTSGWDIAEKRKFSTTGFSGTNDNQYVLPLSIEQRDSEEQLHTNAKVLSYLLLPENQSYERGSEEGKLSIDDVLMKLVDNDIQVLLDVGAQILELSNEQVAARWLELIKIRGTAGNYSTEWKAVIYFNDHDDAMVMSGTHTEPFETSSFSMNMKQCVVYLDEAHTRGTDFKLPTHSTAAVALGPGLTKDRLVQACMRMRKLGHGQSVRFIAPAEVDTQIRELANAAPTDVMTSLDVIRWTMKQTCSQIQHSLALWANQGSNYQLHQNAWEQFRDKGAKDLVRLRQRLLERESQTLQEMYGVPKVDLSLLPLTSQIPADVAPTRARMIRDIRLKCTRFGIMSLQGVRMQEEQEREIAHEIERETQKERPPRREASTHKLDRELVNVVTSGQKPAYGSTIIFPAFELFKRTSFGSLLELGPWPSHLYTTKDFCNVISATASEPIDVFTRPVYWILFEHTHSTFIVISPYEANELLPMIRSSKSTSLHIYSPKVRLAMKSLEQLMYCPTPYPDEPTQTLLRANLQAQMVINLFAGQLYIKDYPAYLRVCDFLGIYVRTAEHDGKSIEYNIDAFVGESRSRRILGMSCTFERSPVEFLKSLFSMRRKQLSWEGTHMGDMLSANVYPSENAVSSWEEA